MGITVGQILFRYHTPAGVSADEVTAAQNAGRAVAFQISAGLGVLMGLYCFILPNTPPSRNAKQNTAWLEAFGEVAKMPLVLLFLIAVPVSIIHQFYFVQADAFIGSVQASIVEKGAFEKTISEVFGVGGGLMTIGQMTEILVLAMMPFLTKWFTRKHLLLIGLAAYALRMALWAFMPTLPFVMAGIALHGLCFGCFIFVAFMIVDENTTGDIRATAQSLFNLVIVGIGTIVGSIVAANIVGNWASASGTMDYTKLFTVPMWMAIGCFAIILVAYPNRAKALPG